MKEKENRYDAVLVPGGGVREGGELPLWVCRRLEEAVKWADSVDYIVALSAGTTHKPPLMDGEGFPVYESITGAQYLMKMGVPPGKILTEICSYDTIGNAYFSRVMHVDPLRLRRLLVITSNFHLERTRAIFEWVYGLDNLNFELDFEGTADDGMDEWLLNARREKEKRGLESVMGLRERIVTMGEFHRWLYTEHEAYAVALTPGKIERKIAESY